eukprot:Nk52_evm74s2657 gene=Nk52_evmTU74s2657
MADMEFDRPINELISEALGWASVCCWIIVAFPQFYENYINKTGLSLSMSFLLIWLVGDFFNLAGCFMTGQLATQVYTGVWFTIMDLVLIGQILYYDYYLDGDMAVEEEAPLITPLKRSSVSQPRAVARRSSRRFSSGRYSISSDHSGHSLSNSFKELGNPRSFMRNRRSSESDEEAVIPNARSVPVGGNYLSAHTRQPSTPQNTPANGSVQSFSQYLINDSTNNNAGGKRLNSAFIFLGTTAITAMLTVLGVSMNSGESAMAQGSTGRVLMEYIGDSPSDVCTMGPFWCWLGAIMGWISSALYVFSRVPQLLKNIERQSCEGLSIFMFIMGVLGNLTYSASIFVWSMDAQFLWEKLPWIIGSLGTLAFDFAIFVQFFIYRGNTPLDV